MSEVIMIIGIICCLVAFVSIILLKPIKEICSEKVFNIISSIGVICFIVGLGICFFVSVFDDSSSSSKDTGNWSKEASIECQNRSNTYYKCGWSVIEDRCVCKQR